jgi:putative SOS response-associated peptidase YedK
MRSDPTELAERLEAALLGPSGGPRFNIAPTQDILAAVNDERRTVAPLRWGLVPPWSDPERIKLTTFNARVETIATSRVYSAPLRSKRCAVFADGFYEWKKNADGSKTPYWIYRKDERPFVFAGLWDENTNRMTGEVMRSATIITQPPNGLMETIHNRMPVVLDDERAAADEWTARAVSRAVGNVRNQGPGLLLPLSDDVMRT